VSTLKSASGHGAAFVLRLPIEEPAEGKK